MACPVDGRYNTTLFETAMENLDLWEAGFCAYGAPMGELVVGSVIYLAVGLNIYIRTGTLILPFVLMMVLGGTIYAQMFGIINTAGGIVILVTAPLVLTALVFMIDRRG